MKKDKESAPEDEGKLKRKDYEKELRDLQAELCALQDSVKREGTRVVIIFEGRDGAGKGGTIRALTERVSPRVFRVVALPAPTEREKSQMYLQRYMAHFPAAGEIVIFDRSWYNRAGVEYVMGFCTAEQHRRFLELCPEVERYMVDSGIILLKFWLEVSDEEQKRRFEARITDLGASCAPTTRSEPGSTAFHTCSSSSRTRRYPARRSSSPSAPRKALTTTRPCSQAGDSCRRSTDRARGGRTCAARRWAALRGAGRGLDVRRLRGKRWADVSPLRHVARARWARAAESPPTQPRNILVETATLREHGLHRSTFGSLF